MCVERAPLMEFDPQVNLTLNTHCSTGAALLFFCCACRVLLVVLADVREADEKHGASNNAMACCFRWFTLVSFV